MTGIDDVRLADGRSIPGIGLGTYSLNDEEGARSVEAAIRTGYRLLDTARVYGSEGAVGEGLRRSGVERSQIVVTTKLDGADHAYDAALRSIDVSLREMGIERIDLYLIHWPVPEQDLYVEAWRALIRARDEGRLGSIGVSNFDRVQLERLRGETGELPVLNQVELHPGLPQDELRAAHEELGIATEGYSPLKGRSRWAGHPAVAGAAEAHGVTAGQVALRWAVQLGTIPIPRSKDPRRQAENLDLGGFELDEREMAELTALRG